MPLIYEVSIPKKISFYKGKERQREGIAIAKDNGVYKGRKPIQPPELEKVMVKWQRGEITAAEAMRQLGMSKSTFYRRIKSQPLR